MTLSVGKMTSAFRTKVPGLRFDIIKIGTGSPIERSFNKHAQTIKSFVVNNMEKGGKLPNGGRVDYYSIGDKEYYKIFYAPNKSKYPDVSYEVSPQGASIISEKLKYFKKGTEIIRHLFSN